MSESVHRPRLIVVVSDGSLMVGLPPELCGRRADHITLRSTKMPLAALATTIATGVGPLQHGIATSKTIVLDSMTLRPVESRDRRFPALWTIARTAGLETITIDWPATTGDPALSRALTPATVRVLAESLPRTDSEYFAAIVSSDPTDQVRAAAGQAAARLEVVMDRAATALDPSMAPDILAVAVRKPGVADPAPAVTYAVAHALETFLNRVAADTIVVLVHRRTTDDAQVFTMGSPYAATVLQGSAPINLPERCALTAIGGAAQVWCGLTPVLGVAAPSWIRGEHEAPSSRPFPVDAREDEVDWSALVEQVSATEDGPPAGELTSWMSTRLTVLAQDASWNRAWRRLSDCGRWLTTLRGSPNDYWWLIYGLHRVGRLGDLPHAVEDMCQRHPDLPVTCIARSLLLIKDSPDEVAELLRDIDPATIRISDALGSMCRMCVRAGLEEQAERAIKLAILRDTVIPADRVAMAGMYLRNDKPADARSILAGVGLHSGPKAWRLLRMQVLLANDCREEAAAVALAIVDRFPGDTEADSLLKERE